MSQQPRQQATTGPFDWEAMASGTSAYWKLAWDLVRRQAARLAEEGIVAKDRFDLERSLWAPAVDLALSEPSTFTWFDEGVYVPARDVYAIASASSPAVLLRGTQLRLEAVRDDRYWEGMGTNFWSVSPDAGLGVTFIHSALEGRWGGGAVFADALIVPIDHPILDNPAAAERLVLDLQEITRAFRIEHRLPADGGVNSG